MNRRTFLTHTGIALGGVICTSGCSSTRKVERSPSLLASLAAATAIMVSADVAGVAPPESGIREITIDAGQVTGRIRSLLGVNRGPLSWPREPDRPTVSHMESYRRFGLDFIRTHDFYGPTDWHVIFPRWDADATAAASYDFTSSDERIKAIVENGFHCFYRLGTSWKGRRLEPINDPPGTRRDSAGRVTQVADGADFKKWAAISAQTVRHYTEGWNNGFRFPIEYWEVWNEPDLAAQFWTGTPEQYYMLYEEAARAIKAVNPKLKVGGPACTGGLREAYVERFIRYCAEHKVPLDFFLLDDQHRLSLVEETSDTGRDITLERPFRSGSVCLVELNTASAETKPNNPPIRPIRPGTRPQFPPDR